MNDLYKIADQLIAEMARIKKSGTTDRRLMEYSNKILDYVEDKLRVYK